jgi:hypothetical protein
MLKYKCIDRDITYSCMYLILDFTPYEKNVSFQFLFFINNTYFTQIVSLFLQYLTYNTGTSQVIINKDTNCKNSIINYMRIIVLKLKIKMSRCCIILNNLLRN